MHKKYIITVLVGTVLGGFLLKIIDFTDYFKDKFVFYADFKLPQTFPAFFDKVFYMWNSVNGAVNFDGTIRFFTRIPMLSFSFIYNSQVLIAYFYILFSLSFVVASFYFFSKYFLKINQKNVIFIFSLLFILNPIFLGNFSKLGLVFAASSILLALTCAQAFFKTNKSRYLYLTILVSLFSVIHPFTTLINLFVLIIYFLFKLLHTSNKLFFIKHLVFFSVITIALFLYAILPIISIGTLDKEEISNTIGNDAGTLILLNVAKTDGFLEGFSFSKSVFLDYEFYNESYKTIYFLSSYALIVILLLLIFFNKDYRSKYVVNIVMLIFLLLLLLATGGQYLIGNIFNSFLISLPGGWFFRSPLKWQLYIPVVFWVIFIISYINTVDLRKQMLNKIFFSILILFSLFSSGYLITDIYKKFLRPTTFTQEYRNYFYSNDKEKKVLLIFDSTCDALGESNPEIFDNLTYYLFINNIQLTKINDKKLLKEQSLLNNFTKILTCSQDIQINNRFKYKGNIENKLFIFQNVYDNLSKVKSVENLFLIEPNTSFEEKYSFVNDVLHNDFDFVVSDESKDVPSLNVIQNFENINSSYIQNQKITQSIEATGRDDLYINKDKKNIDLVVADNQFAIQTNFENDLFVNNQKINISDQISKKNAVLLSQDILEGEKYYIENGGQIFPVKNNTRLNENVPIKIYKVAGDNIIKNGGFESGLWQEKVGDCNNYDDNPILDMKQSNNTSDGGHSVELQATRHNACINQKRVKVESGKTYLLSFDYQSDNARQGGYYIGMGENNIGGKLPIVNKDWRKFSRLITIPDNTNDISIFVYSYETDGEKNNIVRYDNFQLNEVELIKEIKSEKQKGDFVKINLPKNDNQEWRFEYRDNNYNYQNLIPNASLEDGLWRKKVGDCNNYDDNAILDMKQSDLASVGQKSLQLEATRHTACTGPGKIPVKGGVDYLLEFDYQSDNAKRAGVYVGFNDEEKSNISEKINIKKGDKDWHTFSKKITVPAGATNLSLVVYSYAKDGRTNIITRYDNFKFIELPDLDNKYYLVSKSPVETAKPKSVDFDLINPTKKLVYIKGATKPFYLIMSESYHDKWQAQLNNEKVNGFFKSWVPFVKPDAIANDKHFKYMTFLNGWYVNPQDLCESKVQSPESIKSGCTKNDDGSYDIEMVIEFTPQRWFYLGLLISGTTFMSLIAYLLYDAIHRRKKIS